MYNIIISLHIVINLVPNFHNNNIIIIFICIEFAFKKKSIPVLTTGTNPFFLSFRCVSRLHIINQLCNFNNIVIISPFMPR